jgi:hypothetical protein
MREGWLSALLLILLSGPALPGARLLPPPREDHGPSSAPGVDFVPSPTVEGRVASGGYVDYDLGSFNLNSTQMTLSIEYPEPTKIEDVQLIATVKPSAPSGLSVALRLDGRESTVRLLNENYRNSDHQDMSHRQVFRLGSAELTSRANRKDGEPSIFRATLEKSGRHHLWLCVTPGATPIRTSSVEMVLRVKRSNVKSAYTVATMCGQGTCSSRVYWREVNGSVELLDARADRFTH